MIHWFPVNSRREDEACSALTHTLRSVRGAKMSINVAKVALNITISSSLSMMVSLTSFPVTPMKMPEATANGISLSGGDGQSLHSSVKLLL